MIHPIAKNYLELLQDFYKNLKVSSPQKDEPSKSSSKNKKVPSPNKSPSPEETAPPKPLLTNKEVDELIKKQDSLIHKKDLSSFIKTDSLLYLNEKFLEATQFLICSLGFPEVFNLHLPENNSWNLNFLNSKFNLKHLNFETKSEQTLPKFYIFKLFNSDMSSDSVSNLVCKYQNLETSIQELENQHLIFVTSQIMSTQNLADIQRAADNFKLLFEPNTKTFHDGETSSSDFCHLFMNLKDSTLNFNAKEGIYPILYTLKEDFEKQLLSSVYTALAQKTLSPALSPENYKTALSSIFNSLISNLKFDSASLTMKIHTSNYKNHITPSVNLPKDIRNTKDFTQKGIFQELQRHLDRTHTAFKLKKFLELNISNHPSFTPAKLTSVSPKYIFLNLNSKNEEKPFFKHSKHDEILTLIQNTSIPIYLYGPTGSGKSWTLQKIAETLSKTFVFTNSPQDELALKGYLNVVGKYITTQYRNCYENGGIFLLDEMDACPPEVLVALNSDLSGDFGYFPDKIVRKHKNFRLVASGNTLGQGGTFDYTARNRLDASTLNRFLIIHFDHDPKLEKLLAPSVDMKEISKFRKTIKDNNIKFNLSTRKVIYQQKLHDLNLPEKLIKKYTYGNILKELT